MSDLFDGAPAEAITPSDMVDELRITVLAREDWLERFGAGSGKRARPTEEIERQARRLEIMRAALGLIERFAARNRGQAA